MESVSQLREARRFVSIESCDARSGSYYRRTDRNPPFGCSNATVPAFLTATASRDQHHFRVELDGRLSSTTRQHRCEPTGDDACAVRVEIARPEERQAMSRAQWNSLRALITALHEAANRADPAWPVTFDETWAKVYGLEPGATIDITPVDKTPV